MVDLTVIYYTSNYEKPSFEEKIRHSLWETIEPLGLPLISVSQKPIDFGKNICVGDVGRSGQNALRQWQIGAEAAKTRFICPAESDMLYPTEYFQYRPETEEMFCTARPVYIIFASRHFVKNYFLVPRTEAAVVVGREYLIHAVDASLKGKDQWWRNVEWGEKNKEVLPNLFLNTRHEFFELPVPIVTFKTEENMHRKTPFRKGEAPRTLPHWGDCVDLIRKYVA